MDRNIDCELPSETHFEIGLFNATSFGGGGGSGGGGGGSSPTTGSGRNGTSGWFDGQSGNEQNDPVSAIASLTYSGTFGPASGPAGGGTENGGSGIISGGMSTGVGQLRGTANFSGDGVQGGTGLSTGGSFYAGPGVGFEQSNNSDGTSDTTVSAGFGAKIEVNRF